MPTLRTLLHQNSKTTALFSLIPRVEIVELAALAGFDVVILDMEHGAFAIDSLSELILAAKARGIHALVRVAENRAQSIGSVLDAGADGVLVPQIASRQEAETVVAAARFAPDGQRGANAWVRAADYSGDAGWFGRANADVAVMIMVEGREGVEAISDILATPGLDGIFLGPVDLSHALGVPGEIDNPTVVQTIEHVISLAREHSTATAVFTPTAEGANKWFSHGVTMAAIGVDAGHILEGFRRARQAVG